MHLFALLNRLVSVLHTEFVQYVMHVGKYGAVGNAEIFGYFGGGFVRLV